MIARARGYRNRSCILAIQKRWRKDRDIEGRQRDSSERWNARQWCSCMICWKCTIWLKWRGLDVNGIPRHAGCTMSLNFIWWSLQLISKWILLRYDKIIGDHFLHDSEKYSSAWTKWRIEKERNDWRRDPKNRKDLLCRARSLLGGSEKFNFFPRCDRRIQESLPSVDLLGALAELLSDARCYFPERLVERRKSSFKLHIPRYRTRHWFLWLRLSAGLAPDRYWSSITAVIPICTHANRSCARTCSFAFLARENNRPWTFQRPWWATDPVPSIIGTQRSRRRVPTNYLIDIPPISDDPLSREYIAMTIKANLRASFSIRSRKRETNRLRLGEKRWSDEIS